MPRTREIDQAQVQELIGQGISQREICRRLGIPRSTLHDYLKRQQQPPVQRPAQTFDTGAVFSVDTDAVQRLNQLEQELQALRGLVRVVMERLDRLPVQTPVQITALPPLPKGKAVRWNLWIHEAIKDEITRLAAERDLSPSQFVQEVLWRALRGGP
jgi:hypothetical protein